MVRIWQGLKLSFSISLILGLVFSGALFSVILYAKITGSDLDLLAPKQGYQAYAQGGEAAPGNAEAAGRHNTATAPAPTPFVLPASAALTAPGIKQHPELPAGCEVTSLTMLLAYAGITKDKLELAKEMKVDPTPIKFGKDGTIVFWGHPNSGYVGDVTRKKSGFGIYHQALFPLLQKYIPSAVDMTGRPFTELEEQIAKGMPVVVWTTINFKPPGKWVEWDTPDGPVRTTFSEHAVLLVGYDRDNVYINNPTNGNTNVKINKKQFMATWDAMGKQALSYTTNESSRKGGD